MKKKKKNSIKTSFWEKIKNIFNNSPWHAAFIYPILYIFIMPIIGGALMAANISNEMGPLAIFGFFLLLSIFLTPIWVFAGLFISKKKTPYILSLCIGLGLFALLIYLQIQVIKAL